MFSPLFPEDVGTDKCFLGEVQMSQPSQRGVQRSCTEGAGGSQDIAEHCGNADKLSSPCLADTQRSAASRNWSWEQRCIFYLRWLWRMDYLDLDVKINLVDSAV